MNAIQKLLFDNMRLLIASIFRFQLNKNHAHTFAVFVFAQDTHPNNVVNSKNQKVHNFVFVLQGRYDNEFK